MQKFFSIIQDERFFNEIVEEKSRFIAYAKFINDVKSAQEFLNELKVLHKNATHICYAYRLDNYSKFSDDGEPSGTAGKPILGVIEKQNLNNIIVTVVRYFGGVKLGAARLTRTYASSVLSLIKKLNIQTYYLSGIYEVEVDFNKYNKFLHYIKGKKIKILETEFTDAVKIKFVASMEENIETEIINTVWECF